MDGCRAYYNKLLARLNIPIVFECTGENGIADHNDVLQVAREASELLSELFGARVWTDHISHWEHSGGFNLYALPLASHVGAIGEMRIVERGGSLVNVSGALSDRLRFASPAAWESLVAGESLSIGYNMGITYLQPRPSSWPAGQREAKRFAIYAAEGVQHIDVSSWRLKITSGEREISLTMSKLEQMSEEMREKDFHCVTGWSVRNNSWRGVKVRELADLVRAPREGWLIAISSGGYSASIPLDEALKEDSMVAIGLNGAPLSKEGGYPARLVLPRFYGWKSAKWLTELIFADEYIDGFWEALAYHERGLVEAEERFKIRNPRIAREGLPAASPPKRPLGF